MAYPDGNMTHLFKDQSILVMDSEPEGNLKQEKKKESIFNNCYDLAHPLFLLKVFFFS